MQCIEGGESRQASVANASRAATGDLLLVHDAARPLVSPQVIRNVIEAAQSSGAAIAALPVADTVKQARTASPPSIAQTLDRQLIWLAQTPQIFRREVLLQAQELAAHDGFIGTDCASLVERLCDAEGEPLFSVTLVKSEECNFKVTYAADVERASALLEL